MQLTEHHSEQQFFLRHADAQSVTVIDRVLRHSTVVSATRIVEDFPVRSPNQFDDATIESILATVRPKEKPEKAGSTPEPAK